MYELRKRLQDLRSIVYLLAHLVLIVAGLLLALFAKDEFATVGLGLLTAGVAGYVVFVYVLVSRDLADRLEVIRRFGISQAFSSRATKIQPEYAKRVAKAQEHIDVLAFGLSGLREDFLEEFADWKRRAMVRFLLIDPDYPNPEYSLADLRDLEERRQPGTIRGHVQEFVAHTKHLWDDRFTVRLYRCLPNVNIFRVDHEIFWGPYFVREQGRNTPTFIADKGEMFDALVRHFDRIWEELSREVPEEWLEHESRA